MVNLLDTSLGRQTHFQKFPDESGGRTLVRFEVGIKAQYEHTLFGRKGPKILLALVGGYHDS